MSQSSPSERVFSGLPASSGVASAVVHVLQDAFDEPSEEAVCPEDIDAELDRLDRAMEATKVEIRALQERTGEVDIFETHLMILEDVTVLDHVRRTVRARKTCVDSVYFKLMRKHMDALRGVDDAYLRERFIDLKDITQRVMRHLRGDERAELTFDQPVIVVAHDLTPSDTVQIDREMVAGFAIETGSANSHAAIIARSLGIPAVVRLHGLCSEVHTGDIVVLDGDEGLIIHRPCAATLARYRQIEADSDALDHKLLAVCNQPAVTCDGRRVRVGANAEFVEELDSILTSGAEEIGLFRTEFMHLQEPDASEETLTALYTEVVQKVSPRKVIFRTLDLGGDKLDPLLAADPEPNPFLGWRGIRASLGRPDFFKRQLRALMRATCAGEVAIMFPMVSGVEEVQAAKAMMDVCRTELEAEGVPLPAKIEVGAMIEIPSAACTADLMAPEVDFFSLGTNDLVQYTIAVDRLNERVVDLYQSTHPGVLRLINMVVEAARVHNVRVAICGEMAGDLELTPLLIGLGLDELSASTGQIPCLKEAVRRLNHADCAALAKAATQGLGATAIYERSKALARSCYADLLD